MCRNFTIPVLETIPLKHRISKLSKENMKYTLTLLFIYNAEVIYALKLRHLSSKIKSRYITRKARITYKKYRAVLIHVKVFLRFYNKSFLIL